MGIDYKDYDQKIERAKNEILAFKKHHRSIKDDFAARVTGYISGWAETLIQNAISRNPALIVELGQEKIGTMKKLLRAAQESIPSYTEDRMEYLPWPHEAELPSESAGDDRPAYRSTQLIAELEIIVRIAIGSVGRILDEYGFEHDQTRGNWKQNASGEYLFAFELPSKGHDFSGAEEWENLQAEFKQLAYQYADLLRNYTGAINAKKHAQAKDIWDNA